MAVIQFNVINVNNVSEFNDVLDVLQERGLEYAISYESDGVFVYGTADTIQQIQNVLWAIQMVQESGFQQEAGVSYAISVQK